MKKSKIIVSLAMALVVVFTLTSCGAPYSGIKIEDYVKVADYKGLEKEKISVKVTDKEVTDEINSRLEAVTKTVKVTKGTVKDNDVILIDYVGTIDGKEFKGGSANDHSLTIGSGEFIDGFESGLVGVKVGTSKTLKLKFPKNYNSKELAGKDVTFKVKVKSKDVQKKPELNEDFIKENSKKSKTVAKYKEEVKAD
ncbi:MAG: FKBP-type peptidyl-prolyl cis-trans isomerase, partial [Bacilli bacterium]